MLFRLLFWFMTSWPRHPGSQDKEISGPTCLSTTSTESNSLCQLGYEVLIFTWQFCNSNLVTWVLESYSMKKCTHLPRYSCQTNVSERSSLGTWPQHRLLVTSSLRSWVVEIGPWVYTMHNLPYCRIAGFDKAGFWGLWWQWCCWEILACCFPNLL